MKTEELSYGLKLLFENFWIIRSDSPEDYAFLRRYQGELQKELRQRFGMSLIIRPQYIQVLKRPHHLDSWMGEVGFTSQLDYSLFCCGMAYVEGLEAETPFMLDELIRDLELNVPEEIEVDWTNYNHRKSLIRVIKKMLELRIIENIQGETSEFEQSEANQEVLFATTILARAFLSRAPQSYMQYENFDEYWNDIQENRSQEGNQLLYQRFMMEPIIQRTKENEETFVRLRNYYHVMKDYIETATFFHFELYRDYAAFTLEQRDHWQDVFPSRKVVDEILIQLATIVRRESFEKTSYGLIILSYEEWNQLLSELQEIYVQYWSKEFSEMSTQQLSNVLLERGREWHLFEENEEQVIVKPVFGRLIAEMRREDDE